MDESQTPLGDSINRVREEGLSITAEGKGKDAHGEIGYQQDIGKPGGWSLGGAVQVAKSGVAWMARVVWKPKP